MEQFTYTVNGKKFTFDTIEALQEGRSKLLDKGIEIDRNSITIEKVKFSASLKYVVSKEEDEEYKNHIISRNAEITIINDNENICYNLLESFVDYVKKEINTSLTVSYCPSFEDEGKTNKVKMVYTDYIEVDNKEEFNELKDLFKDWKKSFK